MHLPQVEKPFTKWLLKKLFLIFSKINKYQLIIKIFSFSRALRGVLANLYIEPTRPLYPTRRRTEPKKVANIAIAANRDVFILVNLIGAIDLPIRREALDT